MAEKLLQNISKKLDVSIKNRKETLFSGEALAITSSNDSGRFDILPFHANFITMVKDYVEVYLPDGTNKKIDIKKGVLHNSENKIDLYLTV